MTTLVKKETALKIIRPLRRRFLQFRSVLLQCLPIGDDDDDGGRRRKRGKFITDHHQLTIKPDDEDQGRTCVLPLIDEDDDALMMSTTPDELSPSSPLSPLSSSNDDVDVDKPVTPAPTSAATVILEPLRPHHRGLASRVNRTFLLRKTKAALNKVKQQSEKAAAEKINNNSSSKKPVSSSSTCSSKIPHRLGLNLNKSSSSSKPPSSSASSSGNSSSSRPRFHSAKASTPNCLMTFVIFTNGSSTRMWFLVARQPPCNNSGDNNKNNDDDDDDDDDDDQATMKNHHQNNKRGNRNNNNSGNNNDENVNNAASSSSKRGAANSHHHHQRHTSERPSSSTGSTGGRRRNVTSPTQDEPPSHQNGGANSSHEKKRSLINRFLCSEDGKCTGADGRSRLAIAASWACPAAIKLLLRRGAPVNSVDSRGKAALHYVAYGHSSVEAVVECLLLLLDAGAQVNCFDDEYNTPLHLAALAGCGPAMGLLLRRGADSSLPNATGRTPVFNFLNNAFNADNIPALLELACGSPYAFAGAFHLSENKITPPPPKPPSATDDYMMMRPTNLSTNDVLLDSFPSKKLLDTSGRMPLVLKLTLQPSLMPVHIDESLVLSSQFKELLCLFATCPPSLQLLATHSIRNAILDALHAALKSPTKTPSTDSIKAAASVIDLPNSLKCFLFAT